MQNNPLSPPYRKGEVIAAIGRLHPKHFRLLIGIDGLGASGKSTIAHTLASARPHTSVIHIDDFYRPLAERTIGLLEGKIVSPDFDWDRLDAQVFQALTRGMLVKYQRYDWRADRWGEWIEVPESDGIIIVGVYALQSRFFPYYDYTIWAQAPKEIRLKRMIEREGEAVAQEWLTSWSAREERYLEVDGPDKRATSTIFANTSA